MKYQIRYVDDEYHIIKDGKKTVAVCYCNNIAMEIASHLNSVQYDCCS